MTARVDTSPEGRRRHHMAEVIRIASEHGGELALHHGKFWTYEGVQWGTLLGNPFPEWSAPAVVVGDLIAAGRLEVIGNTDKPTLLRVRP